MLNITHATNHQYYGTHGTDADKHLSATAGRDLSYQILLRALMAGSDACVVQTTGREKISAADTGNEASTEAEGALPRQNFMQVIQQRELTLHINDNPTAVHLPGSPFSNHEPSDSSVPQPSERHLAHIGAPGGLPESSHFDGNADERIDLQDSLFAHINLLRFDAYGQQQVQRLAAPTASELDVQTQNASQALGSYGQIDKLLHV